MCSLDEGAYTMVSETEVLEHWPSRRGNAAPGLNTLRVLRRLGCCFAANGGARPKSHDLASRLVAFFPRQHFELFRKFAACLSSSSSSSMCSTHTAMDAATGSFSCTCAETPWYGTSAAGHPRTGRGSANDVFASMELFIVHTPRKSVLLTQPICGLVLACFDQVRSAHGCCLPYDPLPGECW